MLKLIHWVCYELIPSFNPHKAHAISDHKIRAKIKPHKKPVAHRLLSSSMIPPEARLKKVILISCCTWPNLYKLKNYEWLFEWFHLLERPRVFFHRAGFSKVRRVYVDLFFSWLTYIFVYICMSRSFFELFFDFRVIDKFYLWIKKKKPGNIRALGVKWNGWTYSCFVELFSALPI